MRDQRCENDHRNSPRRSPRESEDAPVPDAKAAEAMAQRSGYLLCPRCGVPGQLTPSQTCPYCGYYFRCPTCGD